MRIILLVCSLFSILYFVFRFNANSWTEFKIIIVSAIHGSNETRFRVRIEICLIECLSGEPEGKDQKTRRQKTFVLVFVFV